MFEESIRFDLILFEFALAINYCLFATINLPLSAINVTSQCLPLKAFASQSRLAEIATINMSCKHPNMSRTHLLTEQRPHDGG